MSETTVERLPDSTPWSARARLVTRLCVRLLRRWWWAWVVIITGIVAFSHFFTIGINVSPSLPQHVFLVHKGAAVSKGDFIAFRWHGGGPIRPGVLFVKIAAGTKGDVVTREGRNFYLNGELVGIAKERSLTGMPLDVGPIGVIPQGEYYVLGTHKDSLDSRYAIGGWIKEQQVIGRAYALF